MDTLTATEVIVACIILFLVLLPLYNLPSLMRSRRIAAIAGEFGLSFTKGTHLFNPFEAYRWRKNVISGSIKGHSIEAYDSSYMLGRSNMHRRWVVLLNGQEQPIQSAVQFLGLRMPTEKIREYLSSIA